MYARVGLGLERFLEEPRRHVSVGQRAALLYNSGSVDSRFVSARDRVAAALGEDLVALFGPQHGVVADVQDNMIESCHRSDPELGIPVWSLYSETREPTPEMLEGLDVVLVDLQDVGTRVYTFAWTLYLLISACGEAGVRVVVLDRPNPIGGDICEGNLLDREVASFVGLDATVMRHGLTIGEFGRWAADRTGGKCEVEVVKMEGWERPMRYPDTGLGWVPPSPNMPSYETSLVYPGTVLLEGSTASEGRGTTRPFETVGLPGLDPYRLARKVDGYKLDDVVFRPVEFLPTFQKWAGRGCGGVFIHPTGPGFKPYLAGIALLCGLAGLCGGEGFGWNPPPYEYEEVELPINLLLGDRKLSKAIMDGAHPAELAGTWRNDELAWEEERRKYLIY